MIQVWAEKAPDHTSYQEGREIALAIADRSRSGWFETEGRIIRTLQGEGYPSWLITRIIRSL